MILVEIENTSVERIQRNSTFNPGFLEVIVGTMYSGKSKELIERGIRAQKYGGIDVMYFKPSIDTREDEIASRTGLVAKAILVNSGKEILSQVKQANHQGIIIIDEAQFFDESLLFVVQLLKFQNYNIVVGGLDKDFRGQPFGIMPQLMALSDVAIRKVYPVCSMERCVEDGTLPQRLRNMEPDSALSKTVIIEGSNDRIEYKPVCKFHHIVPDLKEYINKLMYDESLDSFFTD